MCWPQKSTLLGGIGQAALQAKRPTASDLDFAETVESSIQPDFEKLPRRVDGPLPVTSMPKRPAQPGRKWPESCSILTQIGTERGSIWPGNPISLAPTGSPRMATANSGAALVRTDAQASPRR